MRGTCDLWSHTACGLLCDHNAQHTCWDCQSFNLPLNGREDWLCRAATGELLCKHTHTVKVYFKSGLLPQKIESIYEYQISRLMADSAGKTHHNVTMCTKSSNATVLFSLLFI